MYWRALVFSLSLVFLGANGVGCDSEAADSQPTDAAQDVDATDTPSTNVTSDADADGEQTCWSCHGQPEAPNPPPDLSGSVDRASPGVGAHAQHLAESAWHAQVRCQHCHPVPEAIDDAGHIDEDRPSDVVFAGLAAANLTPSREGDSCMVFCHGATMHNPPGNEPEWTSQSPMTCTSCHGMPPAAPHPDSNRCSDCHLEVIDEEGHILSPSMHLNVELLAPHHAHLVHLGGAGGNFYPCTTCHDGENYHGPLRDGHFLDETIICGTCHPAGSVSPEDWVEYVWPSTSDR